MSNGPKKIASSVHAHHGSRPVRKSVSVHVDTAMLPSTMEVCASGRDRGAGPRTTLPFSSYCEPWQGQQKRFAARFHGTTQPRCVHTAPMPKSLMPVSVVTMYVASPFKPCTSSRSLYLCVFFQPSGLTGAPDLSPQSVPPTFVYNR